MRRRDFLKRTAAAAALTQIPNALRGQQALSSATVRIDPRRSLHSVPEDLTGLSYESAQLAHPHFFAASNHELVGLVKRLSPTGVLRIGGNTSELTVWTPQADNVANDSVAEPPSAGKNTAESYAITPGAIRNLRDFLDATGWRLIYGLNLARGTPQAAADEAGFVAEIMGDKLVALQFGNEPDLFHYHADEANKSAWTYQEYAAKWLQFERAVRARLPGVPLAGPDAAYKMDWVTQFAAQMRGKFQLLTGHYYIGGPPSNPDMNIAALMTPPKHLLEEMPQAMAAAKVAGVPYRMAEGNSCYQGGKAGVSDVFASALWVGDYMLQLAQAGYAGVNLHGGGKGFYTPIATDAEGKSSARPEYYGLLLGQMFAGARLVACDVTAHSANVTAYAAEKSGKTMLAVFNKGPQPVQVDWPGEHLHFDKFYRLRAPSVDSKAGVTFAGSSVGSDGEFAAQPEDMRLRRTRSVTIEGYSAVVMET